MSFFLGGSYSETPTYTSLFSSRARPLRVSPQLALHWASMPPAHEREMSLDDDHVSICLVYNSTFHVIPCAPCPHSHASNLNLRSSDANGPGWMLCLADSDSPTLFHATVQCDGLCLTLSPKKRFGDQGPTTVIRWQRNKLLVDQHARLTSFPRF